MRLNFASKQTSSCYKNFFSVVLYRTWKKQTFKCKFCLVFFVFFNHVFYCIIFYFYFNSVYTIVQKTLLTSCVIKVYGILFCLSFSSNSLKKKKKNILNFIICCIFPLTFTIFKFFFSALFSIKSDLVFFPIIKSIFSFSILP